MSKVDRLRELRELRYAYLERPAHLELNFAIPEFCGHKNMQGSSCTRPQNHSEKNHRYK